MPCLLKEDPLGPYRRTTGDRADGWTDLAALLIGSPERCAFRTVNRSPAQPASSRTAPQAIKPLPVRSESAFHLPRILSGIEDLGDIDRVTIDPVNDLQRADHEATVFHPEMFKPGFQLPATRELPKQLDRIQDLP